MMGFEPSPVLLVQGGVSDTKQKDFLVPMVVLVKPYLAHLIHISCRFL